MRGELYDWEGRSATRLAGQNVRGFISLKLKKVDQFMMDRAILLACLIETWQVTPNGCETQELNGFQSCTTARRRKYADADEMIWPLFTVRRCARHGKREARCSYTTSRKRFQAQARHEAPLRYRQADRAKIKVRHQGDAGGKELAHGAARGRFCRSPSYILHTHRPASATTKS